MSVWDVVEARCKAYDDAEVLDPQDPATKTLWWLLGLLRGYSEEMEEPCSEGLGQLALDALDYLEKQVGPLP